MDYSLWSILLLFSFGYNVYGIRYTHMPNTQKCFKDEVQAHQLTNVEFEVSDVPGQRIDYEVNIVHEYEWILSNKKKPIQLSFHTILYVLKSQLAKSSLLCDFFQIRDSRNGILSKREGIAHQAKASFTTEIADTYELCIISHVSPGNVIDAGHIVNFNNQLIMLECNIFRYSWSRA